MLLTQNTRNSTGLAWYPEVEECSRNCILSFVYFWVQQILGVFCNLQYWPLIIRRDTAKAWAKAKKIPHLYNISQWNRFEYKYIGCFDIIRIWPTLSQKILRGSHFQLDFSNSFSWVKSLGTCSCTWINESMNQCYLTCCIHREPTIENSMATVQTKRVL